MLRKNHLNKYHPFKRVKRLFSLVSFCFLILCGYAPVAYLDPAPDQMLSYLIQENNTLTKTIHDEENRLVPNTDISIKDEKQQLVTQRQLIKSKIQTFEQFLFNEQKNQQENRIKVLEKSLEESFKTSEDIQKAFSSYKLEITTLQTKVNLLETQNKYLYDQLLQKATSNTVNNNTNIMV